MRREWELMNWNAAGMMRLRRIETFLLDLCGLFRFIYIPFRAVGGIHAFEESGRGGYIRACAFGLDIGLGAHDILLGLLEFFCCFYLLYLS